MRMVFWRDMYYMASHGITHWCATTRAVMGSLTGHVGTLSLDAWVTDLEAVPPADSRSAQAQKSWRIPGFFASTWTNWMIRLRSAKGSRAIHTS